MASSQKSAANSSIEQQVKLWIELKEKVDLVYKQLNQYRGACRSVDRLNRAIRRTNGQLDPDRMLDEFVKFGRDYRVSRKRLRKLDRQLLAVNLYDKLYDLYESLVMGESIGTGGDLIDSSAIDKAVVDCNGPVGIEDTSVDDFAGISIDPDTQIDVEMDLMEDACLEPRQSETLNHSNKSSTDVRASTRVTRQQTRRRMVIFGSVSRKVKDGAICSQMSMGINDNPVDDFSSISFDHHESVQSDKGLFQCPQCDKSFKTSSALWNHKRTHDSEPRFKCSWEGCDFGTHRNDKLKVHKYAHTGERPFQCPHCDKSFKSSSQLSNHKRTHESEPRFKCCWEGCDFRTNSNDYLKQHRAVHSDERPFQCPLCDKSFKTSTNLIHHKRTHESEPRFKCSWEGCDFGTYYSQSLKAHQTVHTGERPFQCPQCDKSFKRASQLCSHKWTHESELRFKCSWEGCDYGTNFNELFKAHQTVHTGKHRFKCSWEGCGYGTHDNYNLKVHQTVHSDERPFQCSQCDKSFKTSSILRVHKQIHESEPRFKCSWEGCDYSTHDNYKLKDHQTVHSDERPFQCPQCDKSFKTSSILRVHKRTHESEPRFKCSWVGCDYGSHQLVSLTKHQNRHMANRN